MLDLLPYFLIVIASFGGIILTVYIHQKKRHHAPMVCPLGSDCAKVIHSEFSTFLGVPVELWGMLYYTTIFTTYFSFIMVPISIEWGLLFLVVPASLGAFLFSGYLTFIQAFSLKQWCTWCLTSAGISTLIFLLTLSGIAPFVAMLVAFLIHYKLIVVGIHLFGLAIGLGGATMADMFFFKFLKDLRISDREAEVLRGMSQIIWLGLAILVISGVGLVMTDPLFYFTSARWVMKMVVVAVIIVNGAFLNLYITPKLVHISFGDPHQHSTGELRRDRRLAFALGAVSASSWYSAFILGLLPFSPAGFGPLLLLYLAILLVAVTGSQIIERFVARRGWLAAS
jgi:uncharacterized membrane protein